MPDNASRIWFITGCSTGFGRALAEAALAAGHCVTATARDVRMVADLEQAGRCQVLPLDVTDAAAVNAAVQSALTEWGRLDVVVNNAGQGLCGAVEECSDAEARQNMETNFFAPLNVLRAVLPALRAQRSGHLVAISAAAAISNYPGFGIYGAAKAAVEFLHESLRQEVAPFGVKVTLVEPGPFRTAFVGKSLQTAAQSLPDYDPTSGKFRRLITSMDGKQPGDPAKAAAAILAAVESPAPPLRLVLGKYANAKAARRAAELERERTAWESVGLPTDY